MILRRRAIELDKRGLQDAVATGGLVRVRRGWYAEPGTDPDLMRAVAEGGQLACVSALQAHGVWTMPHSLHLSVPPGAATSKGIVRHVGTLGPAPVEPAEVAFRRFVRCGSPLEVVVAADSAIQRNVLSPDTVAQILGRSGRNRRMLSRVDGAAESGLETIARVRLRARGVKLGTQVPVGGYRVDLLVGDRLVIELDGRQWHDTPSSFEWDRRRDAALVASGYIVLRFSFRRVMQDWDAVESQILTVIRRGDHLRPRARVPRSTAGEHPTLPGG